MTKFISVFFIAFLSTTFFLLEKGPSFSVKSTVPILLSRAFFSFFYIISSPSHIWKCSVGRRKVTFFCKKKLLLTSCSIFEHTCDISGPIRQDNVYYMCAMLYLWLWPTEKKTSSRWWWSISSCYVFGAMLLSEKEIGQALPPDIGSNKFFISL